MGVIRLKMNNENNSKILYLIKKYITVFKENPTRQEVKGSLETEFNTKNLEIKDLQNSNATTSLEVAEKDKKKIIENLKNFESLTDEEFNNLVKKAEEEVKEEKKNKIELEKLKKVEEESLQNRDAFDFLIVDYHQKGEKAGEVKSIKVDIDAVADYLISIYNFKTWFGVKNDYSYTYDGKIFVPNTRGVVKVACEKLLKEHCRKNVVEEVFDKIKRKTKVEKEEFEVTDTNFICLENGVWDIENKKLLPHDPKYNFQTYIPLTYDPNAQCPNWNKFIEETLYQEDLPVIQEWFGFNLFREYFIKKAVICVGPKNTGKSVLLDTLVKFIGEKNKTGLSLQKISSGSDFTKLSLKNKHSNIYDDLSSKDLSDGGAFKVATGGGYISGEEKFGEYQQFRSFAKQMFATNKIPVVKDNDDLAYFDRWIVLKFDNIPEKLNPFLRKKLWTPEEMSGILNWALEGLYRLLENGAFSYKKSAQEIKVIMEENGSPLVAFSNEMLQKEDGHIITKDDMYQLYSVWCEKEKKPRLTKEMLGRQLTKYCNYINPIKQKKRIWQNVKINENLVNKLEKSVGTVENKNNNDNTDTSDTFLKFIRDIRKRVKKYNNIVYIKLNKVSEVSKDITSNLDNFSEKKMGLGLLDFFKENPKRVINLKEIESFFPNPKQELSKLKERGLIFELQKDKYQYLG